MSTHNMITIKGIEQIILLLVDADPELKSARPYGEFRANNSRADSYPVLFYEFAQGDMTQIQPGKWNREITMALGVAIQMTEGRVNEIDMKSRAMSILEKTVLKLRASSEFAAVGVRFPEKSNMINNLDETGDDNITGVFTNIKFVLPVILCIDDLPYLPLGTQANTYTPSSTSSLFCSLIADCALIEEMQDDIALLFTLTGGTSSGSTFVCADLEDCADYVAVSATTQLNTINISSLSATTQQHTAQIIQLQGLTGGTPFDCAALESCDEFLDLSGTSQLHSQQIAELYTLTGSTGSGNYLPIREGVGSVGDPFIVTGETVFGGNVYVGSGGNLFLTSDLSAMQSINVAGQIQSGGTDISTLFAPIGSSGVTTYVQPGTNITTGGTITRPTVNLSPSISLTELSATTLYQGSTPLASLFAPISVVPTHVQPGTNTTTGGTASAPTINLVPSPLVNNLIASGTVHGDILSGDTLYIGADQQVSRRSVRLTSDFVTSSTTAVDVTAFSFSVEANTSYSFEFVIAFQSSSTSAGAGFTINGPASPTLVSARLDSHQSAGNYIQQITGYNVGAAALSTASTGGVYSATVKGTLVNGANAGTFILRALRGASAANITVKAGSSGTLVKTS